MNRRWFFVLTPFLCAGLLGCGEELTVGNEVPEDPGGETGEAGPFAVSGVVRLRGTERDDAGIPLAERWVDDADGIPVLLRGPGEERMVLTEDGAFRFPDVPRGDYEVVCIPVSPVEARSGPFEIVDTDLVLSDALVLQGAGVVEAYPNPTLRGRVGIHYFLPIGQDVRLTIRDLSGQTRRTLHDDYLGSGFGSMNWLSLDDASAPVAAGTYWAVLESDREDSAELVFVDTISIPSERRFTFTISASATDPWVNTAAPERVPFLYLWLACGPPDGVSSLMATAAPDSNGQVLAFTPGGGWLNAGNADTLNVAAPCRTGPDLVGMFIAVSDSVAGFRIGLGDVALGFYDGPAATTSCPLETLSIDWVGFSSDGSPPDSFLAGGVLPCPPPSPY